ncbi:MAG TPA: trigger factor [Stellaceae bacterium]|nr:trigger factor [Stellaceae bacterium]
MQITETNAEGLKREFKVTIGADDIARRVETRLNEIGRQVKLPGFRPGKVPITVLKKRYGPSVMGEVIERAVNDSSSEAMREHKLRPALQPKVEIVSFNEGTDLEYKLAVEVLPEFVPMNFAELKLERLRPDVPDQEIDSALERMAKQQRKDEPVDRAAATGDIVVIDFKGSIEGTEFPGGSAKGHRLELGSGSFIPGFEEQLVGAKPGEHRDVTVNFPADYGAQDLAGKQAKFAVDIGEVRGLLPQPIDDTLAEAVGMENLQALRDAVRAQIERDYAGIAQQRLKRQLLDRLAERHGFPVPQGMVDIELDVIWKQFEAERERAKQGGAAQPEDAQSDDEIKAEYRAIAERRVRLGLLLSEVGRNNNIQVTQEEINRALGQEMRRYPGHERQVMEYYRKQPGAIDNLRAPIFENKVVDYILEIAEVTDRSVPPSELLKDEDEEEEGEAVAADDKSEKAEKDKPAKAKKRAARKES